MEDITGLVLAGGAGERVAKQDKGLLQLGGAPLVRYVLHALKPQVSKMVISANRNVEEYEHLGHPVITDEAAGYHGPLAGILAALDAIDTPLLLVVPCDAPSLPHDLAVRLRAGLIEARAAAAVAHDGERLQPVFCLLRRELRTELRKFLERGEGAVHVWLREIGAEAVDFSDQRQRFANINTLQDLQLMEHQLSKPH